VSANPISGAILEIIKGNAEIIDAAGNVIKTNALIDDVPLEEYSFFRTLTKIEVHYKQVTFNEGKSFSDELIKKELPQLLNFKFQLEGLQKTRKDSKVIRGLLQALNELHEKLLAPTLNPYEKKIILIDETNKKTDAMDAALNKLNEIQKKDLYYINLKYKFWSVLASIGDLENNDNYDENDWNTKLNSLDVILEEITGTNEGLNALKGSQETPDFINLDVIKKIIKWFQPQQLPLDEFIPLATVCEVYNGLNDSEKKGIKIYPEILDKLSTSGDNTYKDMVVKYYKDHPDERKKTSEEEVQYKKMYKDMLVKHYENHPDEIKKPWDRVRDGFKTDIQSFFAESKRIMGYDPKLKEYSSKAPILAPENPYDIAWYKTAFKILNEGTDKQELDYAKDTDSKSSIILKQVVGLIGIIAGMVVYNGILKGSVKAVGGLIAGVTSLGMVIGGMAGLIFNTIFKDNVAQKGWGDVVILGLKNICRAFLPDVIIKAIKINEGENIQKPPPNPTSSVPIANNLSDQNESNNHILTSNAVTVVNDLAKVHNDQEGPSPSLSTSKSMLTQLNSQKSEVNSKNKNVTPPIPKVEDVQKPINKL